MSVALEQEDDRLLEIIREKSLLEGQDFKLSSGRHSNFFFDMKMTMLDPEGSNLIADRILKELAGKEVNAIGGLEMGAVPIVSAVCAKSYYVDRQIPAFFVRKKTKGHGTNLIVDGYLEPGMKVALVDDVTTTGGSVLKAVDAAKGKGCTVVVVITVVDREEGASENMKQNGIKFVPLYTRSDFE